MGAILPSTGHLALSGDTFGYHKLGWVGLWYRYLVGGYQGFC